MIGDRLKTSKCVVLQLEKGVYGKIVIEDFNSGEYITLTVFPNWQGEIPKRGDIGYIEFESVESGDIYFNKDTQQNEHFNGTYTIFKTFIRETPRNSEEVIL